MSTRILKYADGIELLVYLTARGQSASMIHSVVLTILYHDSDYFRNGCTISVL